MHFSMAAASYLPSVPRDTFLQCCLHPGSPCELDLHNLLKRRLWKHMQRLFILLSSVVGCLFAITSMLLYLLKVTFLSLATLLLFLLLVDSNFTVHATKKTTVKDQETKVC